MAAMARAKTITVLKHYKPSAEDNYRVQLIFTARSLELNPNDKEAAVLFLDILPRDYDDSRQESWLDLPHLSDCKNGGIPESELKPLFVLQYHLPRVASQAVLLAPGKMREYVSYGLIANWPDSDYAVQMRKVCRAKHADFIQAINTLEAKDKDFFLSRIFKPEGCRTIFFPEQ